MKLSDFKTVLTPGHIQVFMCKYQANITQLVFFVLLTFPGGHSEPRENVWFYTRTVKTGAGAAIFYANWQQSWDWTETCILLWSIIFHIQQHLLDLVELCGCSQVSEHVLGKKFNASAHGAGQIWRFSGLKTEAHLQATYIDIFISCKTVQVLVKIWSIWVSEL